MTQGIDVRGVAALALLVGVLAGIGLGYLWLGGRGETQATSPLPAPVSTVMVRETKETTVTVTATLVSTVYSTRTVTVTATNASGTPSTANASLMEAWSRIGVYLSPREALSLAEREAAGQGVPLLTAIPAVTVTGLTATVTGAPVLEVQAGKAETPGAPLPHGSTNVQVAGVDEPDFVKNNGTAIFVARGGVVEAYRAWPPRSLDLAASLDLETYVANITGPERLILESRHGVTVVANVTHRVSVASLLLGNGTLVAIAVDTPSPSLPGLGPRTWVIALGPSLEPRWARAFPGIFWDARLTRDGRIVLVTHSWRLEPPIVILGRKEMVAYPAVIVTPLPETSTVAVVDARSGEASMIELRGVSVRTLYVSADGRVYLALPAVKQGETITPAGGTATPLPLPAPAVDWGRTRLVRLEATPEAIKPAAEATIPGVLRKQWQMDLYRGVLRVVATGYTPNGTSVNLYTLDANSLRLIGRLEGIALRERIHGVRFIGPYLYLVTYRSVDPLFAIDLHDPAHPRILGYLKAPGFDEYLHPLRNDTLLGVGREDRRVRLTLYRLTGAAPKPIARLYLGPSTGYSWTPVLDPRRGHRAFTYAPGLGVAMLPLSYYSRDEGHFQGIAVISVDAAAGRLRLVKLLNHPGATRATYIDSTVYTVSQWRLPRIIAWDASRGYTMVAEAPRLVRVTVDEIVENPGKYVGRMVDVTGTFLGWKSGYGPPPVTRSDWLLKGKEKAIYVRGAPPVPPSNVGAVIEVIGVVKMSSDGRPYIDPVSVEVLPR